MSHFGSPDWNNPSGLVASLSATSVTAATGTSSTEGTNKLTYTTKRAGLYRISLYAAVRTVGTGAGQVVVGQVAYTDSVAARSAITMEPTSDATPDPLDLLTSTARINQIMTIRTTSGSTITVTMLGSGTFTSAGIYDLDIVIEAL